jgi:hypothetical protein
MFKKISRGLYEALIVEAKGLMLTERIEYEDHNDGIHVDDVPNNEE